MHHFRSRFQRNHLLPRDNPRMVRIGNTKSVYSSQCMVMNRQIHHYGFKIELSLKRELENRNQFRRCHRVSGGISLAGRPNERKRECIACLWWALTFSFAHYLGLGFLFPHRVWLKT
jgi:hypothetical protein